MSDAAQEIEYEDDGNPKQYVTMRIEGQLIGIDVTTVRDVIKSQNITPIPLAPADIEGAFNLRGRVVTVVNMRTRLDSSGESDKAKMMNVVIEHDSELYSFMVDSVGDVLDLDYSDFETVPGNIDPKWKEFASGIFRLEEEILVVLSKEAILNFKRDSQ